MHQQTIQECVEAWRSHATLERQAGESFHEIIEDIESYLVSLGTESIQILYPQISGSKICFWSAMPLFLQPKQEPLPC